MQYLIASTKVRPPHQLHHLQEQKLTTLNSTSAECDFKRDMRRQTDRLRRFVSSRTADQWLMFAVGLVIGLIVG